MSVVLPAPLSPASATTSPARSDIDRSLRACTAPKLLDRCRTSRSGTSRPMLMSFILAPSGKGPLGLVDQHRDDDDHADRDELPERLHVHEDEAILDHRDHE